uniref:Leucine-rich repeat-containing protein 57 n=1 Tax=Panagrellus redivivus TaxID=6233 RepID=A0A7E4VIX1_PANRE
MGNEGSKSSKKGASGVLSSLKSGPSTSVVQRHLETAQKTRVLTLKSANIKTIPPVIVELAPILRSLDLSLNRISVLPPFFGDFAVLKQLHLTGNLLETLPDEIGNLKKLETLVLTDNNITSIPDTIVGCLSLATVKINNNKLTEFPVGFCLLPRLESIDASGNAIVALPDEIGQINASELNFNNNKLIHLNPAIANAKNLRALKVENNELPKQAFTKELLEDSNVNLIAFANNHFQQKDFQDLPGYEAYEQRYTAVRRKGVY